LTKEETARVASSLCEPNLAARFSGVRGIRERARRWSKKVLALSGVI